MDNDLIHPRVNLYLVRKAIDKSEEPHGDIVSEVMVLKSKYLNKGLEQLTEVDLKLILLIL